MKADGGNGSLPRTGASASTLGARPDRDIAPDKYGIVFPGTGGMSVTPDNPAFLPPNMLTEVQRGKMFVFEIGVVDLLPNLSYRPDPAKPLVHGFVEPIAPMSFDTYQNAIWATQGRWRRL
ncbi:MAG: hypothetical protein QOJ59_1917 [Thermomicrobiales bacterium]|jgi:hypothetical protein|nr:hypothetical protein [Thermomicrobiales bacterium]